MKTRKKRRTRLEILTEKLEKKRLEYRKIVAEMNEIKRERSKYLKWQYAHPADIPVFKKMDRVAKYVAERLGLTVPTIYPMKNCGPYGYTGMCWSYGRIEMVVRHRTRSSVTAPWEPERLTERSMVDTLAHEIAHLKCSGHGPDFKRYLEDIRGAVWEAWEQYRSLCRQGLMPKAA
jgi:hypothetical protein